MAASGCGIKLLPGTVGDTLARTANSLLHTDLVVISADVTAQDLDRGWFYLPRMLHAQSLVYRGESTAEGEPAAYRRLSVGEIESLARSAPAQRAA